MTKIQPRTFSYKRVLNSEESNQVASVIAYRPGPRRNMQAVMWAAHRKIWMYAPAIVSNLMFSLEHQDRVQDISRGTAEQISREALGQELPSEQTLEAMCEEGERMVWRLGPPEQ